MKRFIRSKIAATGIALIMLGTATLPAVKAADIVETAVAAGSFKTLAAALQAADLVAALRGKGPFTVLAPSDEAFARLPAGTVETLLKPENKQQLVDILMYHVVSGKVTSDRVVKLSGTKTLNGQRLNIRVKDGRVQLDNSTVVKADIDCSNGVIHQIDSVLLPTQDKIPAVAKKAGIFKTLLAAAAAADLVDALAGKGPLTVFAPTDEAFAKLPAGTVASLLEPENKGKLKDILLYHVVPGRIFSEQIVNLQSLKTLQGTAVHVTLAGGGVKINESAVRKTDIDATNGVIHVIDQILLPAEDKKNQQSSGDSDDRERNFQRGASLQLGTSRSVCPYLQGYSAADGGVCG
jgi:uncharacterized surface protein with fasciclin (FAS1) repeats